MPKVKSIQSTIWERYTRVTGRLTDAYRLYGQIGSTLDITVSDNGQRKPAVVTEFIPVTPETYTLLPAPGYAIRSVCLSFCLCAASYKKNYASCMDLLEILPKGNPFSR